MSTGLDGCPVTDLDVLDQVESLGSFTLVRGAAERLRGGEWAGRLHELARTRGLQLSIRDVGKVVLILDVNWDGWAPDELADAQALRDSHAQHPSRGARLHVVRDEAAPAPEDRPGR